MSAELFEKIVLDQAARYPLMQPADWYKLAFQAALGSEHAVGSIELVQASLEHEIAGLGEGPIEPLIDPISDDERIVRVHLRPYVQNGFSPEALVQAFIHTAAVVHGSAKGIEEYLLKIVELARERKILSDPNVLLDYFQPMSSKDYPPVHHSPEFRQAYRPAYRVIARDLLPMTVK